MFAFSAQFGWVICACSGVLMAVICYARRSTVRPLVAVLLAWLFGYVALKWDPLGVLYWYMV
jgi:hypothetical protein